MTALTYHIRAKETFSVSQLLKCELPLADDHIEYLLYLGAIYRNSRRVRIDEWVESGDVIRVHANPKRFPIHFDWGALVLFEDGDLVAFYKPKGLPVHPTLDNCIENAQVQLSQALGTALFVTHRIDTISHGCVVFAKSKSSQASINHAFATGRVRKIYQALLPAPIEPKIYTHFMLPGSRAPRLVSKDELPGTKRCQLKVNYCTPVQNYWSANIHLLTGRTHQIRTQMAQLGNPLVGDSLYGSTLDEKLFDLECREIAWDRWTLSSRIPASV